MKSNIIVVSLCLSMLLSLPQHCGSDPLTVLVGIEAIRLGYQSKQATNCGSVPVVKQTTEFTCGPAALATLLKYHFGEDTTEQEMIKLSQTMEKRTATLLGLRDACRAKGYNAVGYQMTLRQLIKEVNTSEVPVLVHFQTPTLHYALVTGVVEDYVLVADPSEGNLSMNVDDFLRRWSNKALVVKSETRPAHREIVIERQASAKVRLNTLARAGHLMSSF